MTARRRVQALVVLAALAAACASPSRVVTTPGGSAAVQPTDVRACEIEANAVDSGRARETHYAACMIARGYSATVDVMPPSALALFMAVQGSTAKDPSEVAAAIGECRAVVVVRLTPPPPSAWERVLTSLLTLADTALSVSRGTEPRYWLGVEDEPRGPGWGILTRSDARDAFKGCMETRQYRVME